MRFSTELVTAVLAFAASAAAIEAAIPKPTPSHQGAHHEFWHAPPADWQYGKAHGGALDGEAMAQVTAAPKAPRFEERDGRLLTINLENRFGAPLSIFHGSNFGVPGPLGNPQPTSLGAASKTSFVYPSGWAGRITVGKNFHPAGSKIEGSLFQPWFQPNVDVSYVDGYSVPIVCSCAGKPVSGCNLNLFHNGHACPDLVAGPVCINPTNNPVGNGPATPFFSDCKGAAYTYPNDNDADMGCPGVYNFDCCIGSDCPLVARQPLKSPRPDTVPAPNKRTWGTSFVRRWTVAKSEEFA